MTDSDLRERQAAAAREAVLDRLIERLEVGELDDAAVEDLARSVGVSRRTLYRYFPTREELFAAAGERYVTQLDLPEQIEGADGIAHSFADANRRIAARPALARSLVGRRRAAHCAPAPRQRRVRAIESALEEITGEVARPGPESRL